MKLAYWMVWLRKKL